MNAPYSIVNAETDEIIRAAQPGRDALAGMHQVIRRLNAPPTAQPTYLAEGGMVVARHSGRQQSPERAREALGYLIDDALTCRHPDILEADLRMIGDMIRAIREAEAVALGRPVGRG